MKIERKDLPKSEIELTIEVPREAIEEYETQAAQIVSQHVEVPGFRPGQAPKAFVIAKLGADRFFQETLALLLPRTYLKAIQELKLAPISRPLVKLVSREPFIYTARVALSPAIRFKKIDDIKIVAQEVSVTDAEIDEVLEEMRKGSATFKPVTEGIRKGHRIEIDFEGFDEAGNPVEKTKSTNHPLILGEGTLVPGFEEQMEGMKVAEQKKFPVTFPADYRHEPLKGKTLHFSVALKKAEEAILPQLDEAFVERILGEKKPLSEFRNIVKTDLAFRKKQSERARRENALLEKFVALSEFDVPPLLVDEEKEAMVGDLKAEVEARKLKFEDYLGKIKKTSADLLKEFEPDAEKRVKLRLVLRELFEKFSIAVTDDELKKAQLALLERAPAEERAGIEKDFATHGQLFFRLKNNLLIEKFFTKFLGEPS